MMPEGAYNSSRKSTSTSIADVPTVVDETSKQIHNDNNNNADNNVNQNEHSVQAAAADELLSKELLLLSFTDRNNIQEEIHGVKCIAIEETPPLLEESLKKLAHELDNVLPDTKKGAYLQSQKLLGNNNNNNKTTTTTNTYVNNKDFRLQFLRCDLFDVHKAALRMCKYLDCMMDYFGLYALERPIRLSDFTSSELMVFRKGLMQLLPFRDRSNRRIFVLFPSTEFLKIDDRIIMKIFLYIYHTLVCDIETQMKGLVILVWYDTKSKINANPDITRIKMLVKIHEASPVRLSAVHMCVPDTPVFRFRQSILTLAIGQNRSRLRIHLGEIVEVSYILNGFGIPSNSVPISWTGIIKLTYLKRWMKTRQTLEGRRRTTTTTTTTTTTKDESLRLVECLVDCPYLDDIIFKKGTSAKHHPGNVKFRSLIQSKYELQQPHHSSKLVNAEYATKSLIKYLVPTIIEEIRRQKLRVLNWNEQESCWIKLEDKKHIQKKIEYVVKDFHLSYIKSQKMNRQQAAAATKTTATATATTTITNLRSATLSPDNGGSNNNKLQQRSRFIIPMTNFANDSDDGDATMGGCVSDCFCAKPSVTSQ